MPATLQRDGPADQSAPNSVRHLHLGYLDGIRAVAMLWVMLNHAFNSAFFANHISTNMDNTPHWLIRPLLVLTLGHYAVDVFIVLSGFCLVLPLVIKSNQFILRGGALSFYLRRARRILPPYYLSMPFALAVSSVPTWLTGHSVQTAQFTAWGLITHLLLIQDLFKATIGQINGVLWSVSVEWRIYFLLPILLLAWRKIGPSWATASTVLFSYILYRGMQHLHLNVMAGTGVGSCPHYIGLFAIGSFGAYLAFTDAPSMQKFSKVATGPLTLIVGAAILITVTALIWFPVSAGLLGKIGHWTYPLERRDFLVAIWAASLMAAAAQRPNYWAYRLLAARPLVFLGSFAYSTYLTHEPVLLLVRQVSNSFGVVPLFQLFLIESTVGISVAIGVSYLFHLAFERPFMSKPGTKIKTEVQAEVAAVENPAP